MIIVDVLDSSDRGLEKALSVFKKKVENTKLLEEYKERQYFIKPSLLKRQRRLANARHKSTIT